MILVVTAAMTFSKAELTGAFSAGTGGAATLGILGWIWSCYWGALLLSREMWLIYSVITSTWLGEIGN